METEEKAEQNKNPRKTNFSAVIFFFKFVVLKISAS